MLSNKNAREFAIDTLDKNFKLCQKDSFYFGIAVGNAMVFQILDFISYEEYRYYVDALFGWYFK